MVLLAPPAKLPARLLYAGSAARSNFSKDFDLWRHNCQPGRGLAAYPGWHFEDLRQAFFAQALLHGGPCSDGAEAALAKLVGLVVDGFGED